MLLYPSVPESHNDMLEDASHRYSEEPSYQSEEFCTCEERENGHNGMHSHGTAENAWCKYLPHHNPQEKFFLNDHAPPEFSTLSLRDALPLCPDRSPAR